MADPVFLRGWVLVLGTGKGYAPYLKMMPSNPLDAATIAQIAALTRQDGKNVTVNVRIGGEEAGEEE